MKTKPIILSIASCLIISVLAMGEVSFVYSDASQVLRQFTKSRENLNSFVIKVHEKVAFSNPEFKGEGIGFRVSEYRFDENRWKNIQSLWGDIGVRQRGVQEGNASYSSQLWDGHTAYSYTSPRIKGEGEGQVVIYQKDNPGHQEKLEEYKYTLAGQVMGYHWGNTVHIEELFLRPDAKVQLREDRSDVRGVSCYVIEAEVPGRGKYSVWIDPVHDFHIVRIQVLRKTGDGIYNQIVRENAVSKELFEVLEFQQIGDVWFPKTCKVKRVNQCPQYFSQEESEVLFSVVNLEPDHEELKSFVPDDIPNGAKVWLFGLPPEMEYIWQNGQLVPDVDKSAIEQLDKFTAEMLAEMKGKDAPGSITVPDILAEYGKTQKRLEVLYCEGVRTEPDQRPVRCVFGKRA